MNLKVRATEVEPQERKPKALRVHMVFDPETAQQLNTMALTEGVPVGEVVRTLVIGGLSAYPSWGITAADRKRAFDTQQAAILANLHAWFSEQRWIMQQQINEEERARAHQT